MKRFILLFLIIALITTSLFAVAIKNELTKPLTLQAGYGDVCELYVTPIAAQSQGFMIGMPFNIEDPNVQYSESSLGTDAAEIFGSGSGRIIADWHMLLNKAVQIQVSATPLKPSVDPQDDETTPFLTYSLAFDFTISYTDDNDGVLKSATGYIVYDGNNEATYIWDYDNRTVFPEFGTPPKNNYAPFDDYLAGLGVKDSSFVGNVDGHVIFGFTKDSTDKIQDEDTFANFPVGEYIADVTINIKAVDGTGSET